MSKDSYFLRHEPCDNCGSSDALAVYSDGGRHCFSCEYHVNGETMEVTEVKPKTGVELNGVVAAIPNRKISQKTCQHYKVTVEFDNEGKIEKHYYPYYNRETGELSASKVRTVKTKDFRATGTMKNTGLFGQESCRGRGKFVTVTEGELDAMAAYEMFGQKFDVVSLRSGASAAAKEIKENLEWLEGYDCVVLCSKRHV